ncbi:hypothetical protein HY212_01935 [Candidatus Pacearchaeota archaeon]|nr:hypothetical protein [Candidatus Pacearchaeota archaeon]
MNKMLNNYKNYRVFLTLILVMSIILIILPLINPVGESSFCCEKTTDGAWCQDAPQNKCDTKYSIVPTSSCETTSYCKLGYCYDSQEGTCLPNTPERVCNDAGGVWSQGDQIPPQCSLGCCVVGDQAAFVTQTRCKKISADYGLETNFRADIQDEVSCLASVTSDVMGACVYESEFQKTCRLLSQKDCQDLGKNSQTDVSFHAGYLCSAEELATNCGPTQKTTCVEEKDEVYFLDTCGNLANIYDASKIKDKDYWARIKDKTESCDASQSNANDPKCGNCDYYLGSTCKAYDKSKDRSKPSYGNNICRDLSCTWQGKPYDHGETWCQTNTNNGNAPGSEAYRLVCYNNEVTIEACNSFRQEICIQSETNGFLNARCSPNLWRDCISQQKKSDCENSDLRDCRWISNGGKWNETDPELDREKGKDSFVCVPNYTPGFDFWNSGGEAPGICAIANTQCVAKFEKNAVFGGDWKCKENCNCCVDGVYNGDKYEGCTGTSWLTNQKSICSALGDCGEKVNYQGTKGYANSTIYSINGKVI